MDLTKTTNWTLEQLYDMVKAVETQFRDKEELIKKIPKIEKGGEFALSDQDGNGISIHFYTKGYYKESIYNNKAYIAGIGNFELQDMWNDITERKQLCREILLEADVHEGDATTGGELY